MASQPITIDAHNETQLLLDSGQHKSAKKCSPRTLLLALLTGLVVVLGTINRVLYKYLTIPMGDYAYFISNFTAVSYCLLYFSFFGSRICMEIITPSMLRQARRVNWWRIVLTGAMDALGSLLSLIGAAQLSGPLIVLLPNGTLIFTMIASVILLQHRYSFLQVIAAGTILAGVFLTLLPRVLNQSVESASVVYYVVFFFSTLPGAISFVLKERIFIAQPELDLFVVNSFGSLSQLLFTLAFIPIFAIPGFGNVPIDELGQYIAAGAYCFAGENIVSPSLVSPEACKWSPAIPLIYMAVNLTWNICLLALLKTGGALFMFIAVTVSMPIAENVFVINLPLLPATPFSWYMLGGLLLILAGLFTYRLVTLHKERAIRLYREQLRQTGHVNAEDSIKMMPGSGCCALPPC